MISRSVEKIPLALIEAQNMKDLEIQTLENT